MVKEVDFLFLYEVKARELENICLIRYELEKRGYSVVFLNTWHYLTNKIPKYKAKVVVCPALYNDTLVDFVRNYAGNFNKLVNMQWEQVVTVLDEISEDSARFISGAAKQGVHISWGEKNKKRLVSACGVPENKVKLTGHVTLDFLRHEFSNYYLNRDDLFKEYNIPQNKKICLFISSFAYVNLPDNLAKDENVKLANDPNEFINISTTSQNKILNWIEKILSEDKDLVFIYRPHPAEAKNNVLLELTEKYSRFLVISDHSVKQWIKVTDKIYTWYSTSIAEVYGSKKRCHILRPVKIPNNMELTICQGAKFIEDYSEFSLTINKEDTAFPLDEEILNGYYDIDQYKPSYKRICDVLEEVYNKNEYIFSERKAVKHKSKKIPFNQIVKLRLTQSIFYDVLVFIANNTNFNNMVLNRVRNREMQLIDNYTLQQQKKNFATKKEIQDIINKLKIVLEN